VKDLSQLTIPYLSNEQIWSNADNLRIKNWDESIPVDIDIIAEKGLGLLLTPINDLKRITTCDALLLNSNEIVYDPKVVEVRIRFSIAHEIGHHILHSQFIQFLRPGSIDEWKDILNNFPGPLYGRVEIQANEFAGRLLVPKKNLIEMIKKYGDKVAEARELINSDIASLNKYLAIPLAKEFEVSQDVIVARLNIEKINPFEIIE
jgi:Zn-dependent peptidase ImmA (M78 family)